MQASLTRETDQSDRGLVSFGLAARGESPAADVRGAFALTSGKRRHDLEVVAIPIALALVTIVVCLLTAAPMVAR